MLKKVTISILVVVFSAFLLYTFLPQILPIFTARAAVTYYVSKETIADDSNSGTISAPFRTISKAASVVTPGDIVNIRGGIYQENIVLATSGTATINKIIFKSYTGERAIIDGRTVLPATKDDYLVKISGDYIEFSGIDVKNSKENGVGVFGSNVIVSDVNTYSNKLDGAVLFGVNDTFDSVVSHSNNLVYTSCSLDPEYSIFGSGISLGAGSIHSIIINSTSYDNWGYGISAISSGSSIVNNGTIENSTSYNNGAAQIEIQNVSDLKITKNSVYRTNSTLTGCGENRGIHLGDNGAAKCNTGLLIANNTVMGTYLNFSTDLKNGCNSNSMEHSSISYNTFVNAFVGTYDITDKYKSSAMLFDDTQTYTNSEFSNNIILEESPSKLSLVSVSNIHTGLTFVNNLWSSAQVSQAASATDVILNPNLLKSGTITAGKLTRSWFALTVNSPAIDKGIGNSDILDDALGKIRPISKYDIGALEFDSSAIAIDIEPPVLNFNTPANGSEVEKSSSIALMATATDLNNISKVEFYNGLDLICTVLPDPSLNSNQYRCNWNTPAIFGTIVLTAKAYDTTGNVASIDNTVTVIKPKDLSIPTVGIIAPLNNAIVKPGDQVDIKVDASDNVAVSKVEFYEVIKGSELLFCTDLTYENSMYKCPWKAPNTEGTYSIKVIAYDTAVNPNPNTNNISISITVNILPDTEHPIIKSITTPLENEHFVFGSKVNITADVTDNVGVTKVDYYNGAILICSTFSAPYSCNWSLPSIVGVQTIKALAFDARANFSALFERNIIVDEKADSEPPILNIDFPTSLAYFKVSTQVEILVTATDNVKIKKVEYSVSQSSASGSQIIVNATNCVSIGGTNTYKCIWSTQVSTGNKEISVNAVDLTGNTVTKSVVVSLINDTIDKTPPYLTVKSPISGLKPLPNTWVPMEAISSDNVGVSKVEFYVGSALLCTDLMSPYKCDWLTSSVGIQTVTVKSYDVAENVASNSVTVIVSIPTVAQPSPTNNYQNYGTSYTRSVQPMTANQLNELNKTPTTSPTPTPAVKGASTANNANALKNEYLNSQTNGKNKIDSKTALILGIILLIAICVPIGWFLYLKKNGRKLENPIPLFLAKISKWKQKR